MDITLKPTTIGHLKVLQRLEFDKLDTHNIDTLLKYIVIFTADVKTLKSIDADTLQDMADDLAFELPTDEESMNALGVIVEEHVKATHDKEFTTVSDNKKKVRQGTL